jgi:nucleoside-diphosphate-sugar epimerase
VKRVLVTGAGGFIGHHLVGYLKERGHWVRAVDVRRPHGLPSAADEFALIDVRRGDHAREAVRGIDGVYAVGGGMPDPTLTASVETTSLYTAALGALNTLAAARAEGVGRYIQVSVAGGAVGEEADEAWERAIAERLCAYYLGEHGIETRVVRAVGVYGAHGPYEPGAEPLPVAVCRTVAATAPGGSLIVPDDGRTLSFCHVRDCLAGIHAVMRSDVCEPVTLRGSEAVTLAELVALAVAVSGRNDIVTGLQPARASAAAAADAEPAGGTSSFTPRISLEDGLREVYGELVHRLPATPAPALSTPLLAA